MILCGFSLFLAAHLNITERQTIPAQLRQIEGNPPSGVLIRDFQTPEEKCSGFSKEVKARIEGSTRSS
jgi:hypothetical protein